MAQTEALLDLINEFSAAFADPNYAIAPPPNFTATEPDEEGSTGETPQLVNTQESSFESKLGWCYHCLEQLEHEPELLENVAGILTSVADFVTRKKHLAMAGDRVEAECGVIEFGLAGDKVDAAAFAVDLPETFARQGTPECPGGLCST